ncbi:lipase-like domain-containing protein, partial [Staphylococcus epidermidis]|uniref:lipase-like domain-containing protein n=1 Tax=Staphylococcus epidermidis TaxID=1282 RepID=UPI003F68B497
MHFIPHTIPPQTIPQIQQFLTNPNQQQIQYQPQHPPTISHLFTPAKHNILPSITTLPTPHNPTPTPHKIRTPKLLKQAIN